MKIAKLFKNGASQAVRLPADCRFEGDSVYVGKDTTTGDVVLSKNRSFATWSDFFSLVHQVSSNNDDFMAHRPLNEIPVEKHLFVDQKN